MGQNRSLLSQRQQRCNERRIWEARKREEELQPPSKNQRKKSLPTTTISILDSNSEASIIDLIFCNNNDNITLFQENEIEEINKANEMVQFYKDAIDNVTTDEDKLDGEDEPEALWPVFLSQSQTVKPLLPKRKLKSGKKGYQKLVMSSDSSSQKRVP
jgi:hypothetical protein